MTVFLWDLSNHDWRRHPVDLADARRAGISGVTHKATEGIGFRDPFLDDFARQLRSTWFPIEGTYHAMHPGNARAQADFWFDYVNDVIPEWRKHPCWIWQIDAERWEGEVRGPNLTEMHLLGARLEERARCLPTQIVAYAPEWLYGNDLRGLQYELWASNYGANPSGSFRQHAPGDHDIRWGPYSGKTPIILQFGSRATIGRQATCDINAVRVDSEAELQALFVPRRQPDTTPATIPLDPEDDMTAAPTIVLVDPKDCARRKVRWPGWFLTNGFRIEHIETKARLDALRALGYPTKKITVARYRGLGGK